MSVRCRMCAERVFNPNAKSLFEQDDHEILKNIAIITGIRLNEDQGLPKHICTCCYLDLYHSIAFRDRCIISENWLQRERQRKTQDPLKTPQSKVFCTNQSLNTPQFEVAESCKDDDNLSTAALNSIQPEYKLADSSKGQHDHINVEDCKANLLKTKVPRTHIPQRRSQRTHIQNIVKPQVQNLIIKLKNSYHRLSSSKAIKLSPSQTTKQGFFKVVKPVPPSQVHSLNSIKPNECSHENTLSSTIGDFNELSAADDISRFTEVASQKIDHVSNFVIIPTGKREGLKNTNEDILTKENVINHSQPTKKAKVTVKANGEQKVYVCDLCGLQSSSTKNLEIHILRHKGEKNFECDECGTKFYSKYLLKMHIRVKHQGEMPFECRFCGQRFYSGSTRGRHEQVRHVRKFAFVCKICGKRYNTKTCLNKHEFLHTGLRPYRCELCNVAFPRKPGLKIHCRTKQHQKRASEKLNNQLDVIKVISVTEEEALVFPKSIIEEQGF